MASPDYIVEIQGLAAPTGPSGDPPPQAGTGSALSGRPWLAVRWRCCNVYSRVYRNQEGTAYEGRCPTCGRPVRFWVGTDGTACRFFDAY